MNIPYQSTFGIGINLDPAWCSWFSGWVDGEGSFFCQVDKESLNICPVLAVGVRDDDTPLVYSVLNTLQCGKVYHTRENKNTKSYNPNHRDTIKWRCHDNRACLYILIPLFDRYPLRSKKCRDYEVWRKIVMAVSASYHLNGNRAYVLDLCQQLKDIKKYVPPNLVDA